MAAADVDEAFGSKAKVFVYLGAHGSPAAQNAHFVLPIATFAEQEGSYTNVQGRVQRFWPGLRAPGAARPAWFILGALLAELTEGEVPMSADQAFAQVADGTPLSGLTYRDMGTHGAPVNQPASVSGDSQDSRYVSITWQVAQKPGCLWYSQAAPPPITSGTTPSANHSTCFFIHSS